MSTQIQTDGSGDEPEDDFQLGTDKTRIDIDGSNHDIDEWAEKVVSTQEMLEQKGFDHKGGIHGNVNEFDSVEEYHNHAREFNIHNPIKRISMYGGGAIDQENNEQDISTNVQATGVEMKPVDELEHEPHESVVEEIDGEEMVAYDGAISPFVVARDKEGFAAIGTDVDEAIWRNHTSDEGYSSMEKGQTSIWMNYETPEELSIMVTHSESSDPHPLFEGAVDQIGERLEEYADFSDGIEYTGDSMGQFQLEVDMSGEPEEAVDRVETAYTAVRTALEESLNYEI